MKNYVQKFLTSMDFISRVCHCAWILEILGIKKRLKEDQTINGHRNYKPISRSPSNYCRVSTCETFHIHEVTPKCHETFTPSSTCSSCQNCDTVHIGPNHNQLVTNWLQTGITGDYDSLPEYNPQRSPEHIYQFDFTNLIH
jgi:hypothetical protein